MGRRKGSKNKNKDTEIIRDLEVSEEEDLGEEELESNSEDLDSKIIQLRKSNSLSRPKAVALKCADCNGGQKLSCMIPSCPLFEFNKFKFNLPKGMSQEEIESFKVELGNCGIKNAVFKFKGGGKEEVEIEDSAPTLGEVKPKKKRGVDWGNLTAEQRAAHIARMQAGRKKNKGLKT